MHVIEARGLKKAYAKVVALEGFDLAVGRGRIVGLLGPNGAGKTTALQAILGLVDYEGELKVLGHNPWTEREALMNEACFIADVAVLPRWMRVRQAIDYMEGVHPRFDRTRAEAFLARTTIRRESKVSELSKGMVTQLHLALIMAVDAQLLVLDEPTLGLDPVYRKQFYDSLLNDYVDHQRTIVVSTHDLHEVQNILTDIVLLDRGRVALSCTSEELEARYAEVLVASDRAEAARGLGPIYETPMFGRTSFLFDGVDRQQLANLGDVRTPHLSDLFISLMAARYASTAETAI